MNFDEHKTQKIQLKFEKLAILAKLSSLSFLNKSPFSASEIDQLKTRSKEIDKELAVLEAILRQTGFGYDVTISKSALDENSKIFKYNIQRNMYFEKDYAINDYELIEKIILEIGSDEEISIVSIKKI